MIGIFYHQTKTLDTSTMHPILLVQSLQKYDTCHVIFAIPSYAISSELHDVRMVVLVKGDTNLWLGLQLCCHFLLACFHRRSHCAAEVTLHETTLSP
jgi:hypothetical protein